MNNTHKATSSRRWLTIGMPLLLLLGGAAIAASLLFSRPSAGRGRAAGVTPTLVETISAKAEDRPISIEVMGTVSAAREIELRARVSGHVQKLSESFTPGGLLQSGEIALKLDDTDYRLALRQAQNEVIRTRADLDLERGQQQVAKAQLELLSLSSDTAVNETSLALREPQLAQAEADLDDAEAALEVARLNLERSQVKAPFNALVTERSVNLGSDISTTDTLGTLVGTDEYWIEAAVPVSQLRWIIFSTSQTPGSAVQIESKTSQASRSGHVLRRIGELVESSRMARVLISIPDPMGLRDGNQPLVLNEYVTAHITGPTVSNVIALPRQALRDGTSVWIANGNTLNIRPVNVTWSDRNTVFITSGLQTGEQVVTTDIASPIQGMTLHVQVKTDDAMASENIRESRHDG
ncbi:efflux RND transporter periplasmic adaptor subunit [Desulfovibrio ferrophilus]|uniref:Putative membrane-fusion protein n=1 Tax=Desulfovibrio ferrophilus TaxID=241368 RepID=A0A2Z6AV47_9BACT|nr:efflux RND transporter periplasmic adaptor subunit [Desulfovibrio ferrophilus]BBD07107.1 putative membrane-fusion protein [Desulfovibrio ferrophilus]